MKNPWLDLPEEAEFVTAADRPYVDAFNRSVRAHSALRLRLDLVPEPWMGNPRRARVLLLALNPGFTPDDRKWHAKPGYRQAALANARLEKANLPSYLLDPDWAASPGGTWWRKRLRALAEAVGSVGDEIALAKAWKCLASRLATVEFHGYHSTSSRPLPVTLPSQHFGFDLVRRAVEQERLVVVARGWREWSIAVPELERAQHRGRVLRLKNPQSTYVTPGNLVGGKRSFDMVVDALTYTRQRP